ncbi:hypothetical protein PROFUN_07020 [Planoprotostelium fungivorum]|uniref:Uncharacterized protein n=1 Tax=Planoprotostelium fungivorum TaxID=1890364 RepID=A0A2P6NMQ4_9EUKA|nr:hypothetical protein PROFUN_07020 [Planoprotostelium fungivorum]
MSTKRKNNEVADERPAKGIEKKGNAKKTLGKKNNEETKTGKKQKREQEDDSTAVITKLTPSEAESYLRGVASSDESAMILFPVEVVRAIRDKNTPVFKNVYKINVPLLNQKLESIDDLKKDNAELKKDNAELKKDNAELKKDNADFKQRLNKIDLALDAALDSFKNGVATLEALRTQAFFPLVGSRAVSNQAGMVCTLCSDECF